MRVPPTLLKTVAGAVGAILLGAAAVAQAPPPVVDGLALPQIPFTEFRLANGMRVVLSVDRTLPVVTEAMIFNVGARDERPGQSGFAHLFEHLMFEGSRDAPKGVFDQIVEGHGGNDNASTHRDYTFYYENVPNNVLPAILWLDADRLAYLNVTQTNMKNQIAVVEEEIRYRVTNAAYGRLFYDDIDEAAFHNWYNANPVVGLAKDLNASTLSQVQAFHAKYYAPDNAVLVIVGDMDPVKTRALVEHYFGWIPNHGTITRPNTAEKPQTKERIAIERDPEAKLPAVSMSWQGPPRNSRDFYALTMLGELLFDGKSSLLYQSLVQQHQVAIEVDGGLGFPDADYTDYKAPGLFGGVVFQKANTNAAEVEQLVMQQIHEVEANGVSPDAMNRLRTKFASEWLQSEQTTRDRAELLAVATLFDGTPAAANTALPRFLAVTAHQMQQAARAYLTTPRASVIEVLPGAAPAAPVAPVAPPGGGTR